ncbi:MAG: hypothetical protein QNK29_14440 [Desulfobacterales bacterium]|nr:hypothetical protein [Desulfobacterales bacterium]
MKIKKILSPLICFCICVLTGCVTLDIREANHELVNLYTAKVQAIKIEDTAQEVTINGALDILAKKAAEKCADPNLSVFNRISFGRVATTAAWQAGSKEVVTYAEMGNLLCAKGNNYDQAPRDCGMLLIIPDFAAADELTSRYNAFFQQIDPSIGHPPKQEIAKLYSDIASRLESLLKSRAKIKASAAHPNLLETLDKNIGNLFCRNLQESFGLLIRVAKQDSTEVCRADEANYHFKIKMKTLSFSQKLAPCLPPGEPKKPEKCE